MITFSFFYIFFFLYFLLYDPFIFILLCKSFNCWTFLIKWSTSFFFSSTFFSRLFFHLLRLLQLRLFCCWATKRQQLVQLAACSKPRRLGSCCLFAPWSLACLLRRTACWMIALCWVWVWLVRVCEWENDGLLLVDLVVVSKVGDALRYGACS